MQGLTSTNTAINSNRQMYQKMSNSIGLPNRTYIQNLNKSDSFEKVQYYNDPEKENKKKKKKWLIAGSVGLTALSAIAYAISGKKMHIDLSKINLPNIKNMKIPGVDKVKLDSFWHKFCNGCVNFTNLKDDAWDRFANWLSDKGPLKCIKKGGDALTDWYRNNVFKSVRKPFENLQGAILLECKKQDIDINELNLKNYDDVFKNINEAIETIAKQDRITSKKNLFSGKEHTAKNLFETLTSPIADNKISAKVTECANFIDISKLDNYSDKDLTKLKELIEKYHKLQQTTLIAKLRDINYGCAPTDVITVGIPTIGFGLAVANCDTKEEKKDLMFNLGIPLLPTLFMPVIGTFFPALNGVKALAAGFGVGQVVSQSVKTIDRKIKEDKAQI
ncbi:MAG: hypothetical protein IKU37_04915 [Candidatus Gastranaerophilales bacterium]|nr:hypothetical protein [Candidatus Gastranaerophilales bacterium]